MAKLAAIELRADYDASTDIMRLGLDSDSLSQCNEEAPQFVEKIIFDEKYGFIWMFIENSEGDVEFYTRAEILDWEQADQSELIDYVAKKTEWNKSELTQYAHHSYECQKFIPHVWEAKEDTPSPLPDKEERFSLRKFLESSLVFTRENKHTILDWHWEPQREDPGSTLQHVRETLINPGEVILCETESKSEKHHKNFLLKKKEGFSDPQPRAPYIVIVKYFPQRNERVVLTAFMSRCVPAGYIWRERTVIGHA